MNPTISILAPLYKEEAGVRAFTERTARVMNAVGLPWELVFAMDPCPDGTQEAVHSLIREGYPIRLVVFSRRIGKPLSVIAGLDYATGDACVVIDSDLQDPPELIPDLIEKWKQGYDTVIAKRRSRKGEHFLYLLCARWYYRILAAISDVPVPVDTGDFRLMDARVVRELRRYRERHGFLRGLCASVGFETTIIEYDREARAEGKSRIPIRGAINIALDGIVPFSKTPVRLIFLGGVFLVLFAVLTLLIWASCTIAQGVGAHWAQALSAILNVFLTGVILIGSGVLGEYTARSYEETRDRPRYIVDIIEESDTLPTKLRGAATKNRENCL